jgi:hypothetical protein
MKKIIGEYLELDMSKYRKNRFLVKGNRDSVIRNSIGLGSPGGSLCFETIFAMDESIVIFAASATPEFGVT